MTDDCARSLDLNAPATQRDIQALWKAVHRLEGIGPPRALESPAPKEPAVPIDVAMRLQKEMVVARINEDHLRSKLTDTRRELEEAKAKLAAVNALLRASHRSHVCGEDTGEPAVMMFFRKESDCDALRDHVIDLFGGTPEATAEYAPTPVAPVPREAPETALAADVRRLSMRLEGHNQRLLMQVATVLDRHAAEMSVPREAPIANPKDYPNAFINAVQDAIHAGFSGVGGNTWSEEARLVRITLWGYEHATGRRLDTALTPAPASPDSKESGK